MYFGGCRNELLHFDDDLSTMNVVSAVTGMTSYLEDRYKTNYKRKVAEFVKRHGLRANDRGMPDVSFSSEPPSTEKNAETTGVIQDDEISPNSSTVNISTIEGFGENQSKRFYQIKYDDDTRACAKARRSTNHRDLRRKDIPALRSVCQLLREFESGSRRLSHDELFGLATNLVNVETGSELFLERFKKNSYADGRVGKYRKWVHDMKNYIQRMNSTETEWFYLDNGERLDAKAYIGYVILERRTFWRYKSEETG
jgi:hypothetical protein